MPSRTRSREFLIIGGVAATVTKPAPNVTRIEVHADTPEDADRFAAGLAELMNRKEPLASPSLLPEDEHPVPGVAERTEWRAGDPVTIHGLDDAPTVSDAAEHGDTDGADPNAG